MITLHYEALNDRNQDLNQFVKLDHDSFLEWLHELSKRDDKKTVYLFAPEFDLNTKGQSKKRLSEANHSKEIFIEDSVNRIFNIVNHTKQGAQDKLDFNFFLQEYDSFEEAYKVALNMREPNPLCYPPE